MRGFINDYWQKNFLATVGRKCAAPARAALRAALSRQTNNRAGRRILVACHEMVVAGGLFRFERFGRVVNRSGHHLAFLAFGDDPRRIRSTEFPVHTFDEARQQSWDVTIAPGAGFPDTTIERFAQLTTPQFGLRAQHLLNNQTFKHLYLKLNAAFQPHVIISNNRHWRYEDFSDFTADAFHILEGAVDVERFAPDPRKSFQSTEKPFVIGGLANKNPGPSLAAVRMFDDNVQLRLFGSSGDLAEREKDMIASGRLVLAGLLGEHDLPNFYHGLDCVVHTETFAGWANVAAEAAASGVPLICTSHGTLAFAEHEVTALLLSEPNADVIAGSIDRLRGEPKLTSEIAYNARQRILPFSWTRYSADLLHLMQMPLK